MSVTIKNDSHFTAWVQIVINGQSRPQEGYISPGGVSHYSTLGKSYVGLYVHKKCGKRPNDWATIRKNRVINSGSTYVIHSKMH